MVLIVDNGLICFVWMILFIGKFDCCNYKWFNFCCGVSYKSYWDCLLSCCNKGSSNCVIVGWFLLYISLLIRLLLVGVLIFFCVLWVIREW